ncbi:MAG: class I SAM-dependent methyltransferase [Gammaproteobacteria bacterium]|nr:class I SAM-dependent methyltransferase [Gammaproteobacteria bacterium]
MPGELAHDLKIPHSLDERARQDFVSSLRGFVLHDMANDLREVYHRDVLPEATRRLGHEPADSSEVHRAIKSNLTFQLYSAMRVNAQEMVWDSVRAPVERSAAWLNSKVEDAARKPRGSLTLDPSLTLPRNVSALDVHLMPGNYDSEHGPGDASQGALYDNGTVVFFMGLLGPDQGDIGRSIARFVRARYPDIQPAKMLDLGCTLGHNTLPWAETFPEAEVHAIDVSAPVLRYAFARAESMQRAVHFQQMNATALAYEDNSFDVVWSSMFLHELPLKDIRKVLSEAYRVLRPGGLMLHMELPPNKALPAYDGFYLDWDSWYNMEPFYKTFRDQDPAALLAEAGFPADGFIEHVAPSVNWYGEETFATAIGEGTSVGKDTGRLAEGVSWYFFGARK